MQVLTRRRSYVPRPSRAGRPPSSSLPSAEPPWFFSSSGRLPPPSRWPTGPGPLVPWEGAAGTCTSQAPTERMNQNQRNGKKAEKKHEQNKEHTSVGTIEALNGMGFPTTVSPGLSCSTRPMQLQISSSGSSSDDVRSRSDRPPYIHIGWVLSANGVTRRW